MRRKLCALLALAAVAAAASPLAAQARRNALTLSVGYISMTDPWVIEGTDKFDQGGGILVGIQGEYGLSKQFAVSGFASSTLGLTQKMKFDIQSIGVVYELGSSTTQVGASLIFRPLGTLPNGGPRSFFLEVGGGMNFGAASFIDDLTDPNDDLDVNDNWPFALLGAGLAFPMGPRTTAVVYARYNLALAEYSRPWFEGEDIGQKVNSIIVGAGIRTGF
jgi:hypothetical protein